MKLLASLILLGFIGISPAFAEETYPIFEISEVDVNVSKFQETNSVIVNLLFNEGDILFVTEDIWSEARLGLIINYENLDGDETYINMNNTTLKSLGNVEINRSYGDADNLEKHQTWDFQFSNLNKIFPDGTISKSVSFELFSPEIQFGTSINDVYNVEIVKYGSDVDYTTFNLNDSKQVKTLTEPVNPTDNVQTTLSIEEQMKLQQQQAIAQAKALQEQREKEETKQSELESQKFCPTDYEPVCGVDDITYDNECTLDANDIKWDYDGECVAEPITLEPIPEFMPEPIEEKKCGTGTQLVDGYCKVIQSQKEPVKEQKGFFKWLMSLFGM